VFSRLRDLAGFYAVSVVYRDHYPDLGILLIRDFELQLLASRNASASRRSFAIFSFSAAGVSLLTANG
jgi:hypothetical protein